MKKATFRAIYIFMIPFIFIWIGSVLANTMNNAIFEVVLGIVMFIGVFIYWLFPFLIETAIEYNLDESTRNKTDQLKINRLIRVLENNPRLKKKFKHVIKKGTVNDHD